MKTTRPSFACCVLLCLCAGCRRHAQAEAPPRVTGTPPRAAPVLSLTAQSGDQNDGGRSPVAAQSPAVVAASRQAEGLFLRVRQLIDGYDSIECGTRRRVQLFDHQIVGEGHYWQQGHGIRRLTHFELRSQIGRQIITRFELSDGKFSWTFREFPGGTMLARVDLAQVFQAWDQARHTNPALATREPAASGLPRLLDGIADDFRFERVVDGRLGDRPVWIIEGSWKPEKLATAAPDQKAAIQAGRPLDLRRLPAQLPERIVLDVAQADLFPCRLEYLRRASNSVPQGRAGEGASESGCRPIVLLEWFDAQLNRPIDPRNFAYQPNGQSWTDATDKCLKRLGLAAPQK